MAQTDVEKGHKGINAFIVEKNLDGVIQRQQHICENIIKQITNELKKEDVNLRDLQKHKNT